MVEALPGSIAVLDDLAAGRCAGALRLEIVGTLGLLLQENKKPVSFPVSVVLLMPSFPLACSSPQIILSISCSRQANSPYFLRFPLCSPRRRRIRTKNQAQGTKNQEQGTRKFPPSPFILHPS